MLDSAMLKFMYAFYNDNKVIVLMSIVAYVIRAGIDTIVFPQFIANVFNSLSSLEQKEEFKHSLIMLIVLWIVMKIVFVTSIYCRKLIEPRITEYIINKLVRAVFEKYEAINELSNVSLLINKITLIKKNLQELFFLIFSIFIPKIIVLFLSVINLFYLNRTIGSFIVFAILIQFIIVYWNYKSCLQTSFEEIQSQDTMYDYMQDIFQNINIVQSTYKGYDIEIEKIAKLSDDLSEKENLTINSVNSQQNYAFLGNLVVFIITLGIIYNLYVSRQIVNTEVVTIILTLNGMFDNISDFSIYIPELFARLGVLQSNEDFLCDLMGYMENSNHEEIELQDNSITFKNVTFAFKNHNLLDNFDVTIPANKIIGLFGPSGSGKTTFTKLIFGSSVPTKGEIFIGNVPCIKKNCKSLRKYINYMYQNSHSLFEKSIYENIVYGYENVVKRDKIINLLTTFNLYDIFKNLDVNGEKFSFLDKPAGKLGENLSGGQKAVIHLLRIDLNERCKIIILDEVTASLDNVSRNNIIEYIKYLNKKNKTIFIISHDNYLASICDMQLEFSQDKNPQLTTPTTATSPATSGTSETVEVNENPKTDLF